MNSERPQPPALAIWLLRHLCPKDNQEALTGDLFERFGEDQSDGWFWRQVLIAILVGASRGLRTHWPEICFSIAGIPLTWFFPKIMRIPAIERLWAWGYRIGLPWPMSTAYDFGFRGALAALMVQPILAALLFLDRTFSWISMIRTLLISFALLALLAVAQVVMVLYWSGRGWITHSSMARFTFWLLIPWIILLVSAWVGCRLPLNSRTSDDRAPQSA